MEEPDAVPTVSAAPSYVTREYRLPSGRSYLLRTVVGPGPRRPLVVLLHGLGLDPAAVQEMTGATQFADEHGFVLAYGVGVDKAWNAGTCCALFNQAGTATPEDDVAYLRELVAHASATTAVDRSRVYAWGFSNGAMMAWRAVCQIGDVFAAAGVVGGQLTVECGQSTVAVVHVHGLADTTVPWRGGRAQLLGMDLPDGLLEGFRVGPGSTVERLTWDGGHAWPEWATGALWEFSSRHSLPPPDRAR